MIYTGYFAKLNEYEEQGLIPVSICGKTPSGYDGFEFKQLAPSWYIWKRWYDGEITNTQYTLEYLRQILGDLNPMDVYTELQSIGDNIILICYEKPGDFCHRHIVADWLSTTGRKVDEYKLS